jgi:Flp pilus assembly protein TadG
MAATLTSGCARPRPCTPARPHRTGSRDEGGSVSAELVVVTPLLMLLFLLVVQFALWQHAGHIAEAAAQRGAQSARLQGGTDAQGYADAQSATSQLGANLLVNPTVTVTRAGDVVRVEVTGTAEAVVPFLSLPVTAVVNGPVERFTVPGAVAP